MNKSEIESFDTIYKQISNFNEENDFYEHSREIYQCFYDILTKIDLQNMNVCLFGEIEGFFLIILDKLANSLMVFPTKSSISLISCNITSYIEEHDLKKFVMYYPDEYVSKDGMDKNKVKEKKKEFDNKKKFYQKFCHLQKTLIPLYECAFIFISENTQERIDLLVDNINKSILKEGVIIIFSLEGQSNTITDEIIKNTKFNYVQKYTLNPSNSFSVDITIMQIQKDEIYHPIIVDDNFTSKDLSSLKMTQIYQNGIKKRNVYISDYFMCIYDESVKYTQVKLSEALCYIFIPLYKLESKSSKSNKLIKKESVLNELTPEKYKTLKFLNNNFDYNDSDSFDLNWNYEIGSSYEGFTKIFLDKSEKFLREIAQLSSFSDLNFDARLYTLPNYKTLKEPLDIPVNIKLTSDGIFIYSSSPFYHAVFADYWDINSYATTIPFMKIDKQYANYRQTIAFVFTKGSRQAINEEEEDISIQNEIEKELDLYFTYNDSTQNTEKETNIDNDDDDDADNNDVNNDAKNTDENKEKEEEPQEKEKKDKSKSKQGKNKDKNKDKSKNKDKNKKKDKSEQLNDKTEQKKDKNDSKEQTNAKTEQKKDKNEKPNSNPQENDPNYKIKQFLKLNKQKQLTIVDVPLGCISLKFENPMLMMNFIIAVNQAVSFSISNQIQKNIEKMMTKLNNEKRPEIPQKKDDSTILQTVDY